MTLCRSCGLPAHAPIHTGGHPTRCHAFVGAQIQDSSLGVAAGPQPVVPSGPTPAAAANQRETTAAAGVGSRQIVPAEPCGCPESMAYLKLLRAIGRWLVDPGLTPGGERVVIHANIRRVARTFGRTLDEPTQTPGQEGQS